RTETSAELAVPAMRSFLFIVSPCVHLDRVGSRFGGESRVSSRLRQADARDGGRFGGEQQVTEVPRQEAPPSAGLHKDGGLLLLVSRPVRGGVPQFVLDGDLHGFAVRTNRHAHNADDLAVPLVSLLYRVGINFLERNAGGSGISLERIILPIKFRRV